MHVIIKISEAASSRLIHDWKEEDDYYYGKPHGFRWIAARKCVPLPKWVERSDDDPPEYMCGYQDDEDKHIWIRCSGTWLELGDGKLECRGPRHSVRERIPDYIRDDPSVSWCYIDTMRPDLAPWQVTADGHTVK